MGNRDLPDIYAHALGPAALGLGHIYQANPSCPCYNYYILYDLKLYVYIYTYAYECTHTGAHTHPHARTHACTHAHAHTHTHTHTHTQTHRNQMCRHLCILYSELLFEEEKSSQIEPFRTFKGEIFLDCLEHLLKSRVKFSRIKHL